MGTLTILTRRASVVLSIAAILIGLTVLLLSLAGYAEFVKGVVDLLPIAVGLIAGLYLLSIFATMLRIEKRLDELQNTVVLKNTFGGPVSGFDRGT